MDWNGLRPLIGGPRGGLWLSWRTSVREEEVDEVLGRLPAAVLVALQLGGQGVVRRARDVEQVVELVRAAGQVEARDGLLARGRRIARRRPAGLLLVRQRLGPGPRLNRLARPAVGAVGRDVRVAEL